MGQIDTLTRPVDRIVVKTKLPECQLHGTLQAWWGRLIYAKANELVKKYLT